MNRLWGLICLMYCSASALTAAEVQAATPPASKTEYLPGIALSQGITEITGVAISQLLGVSSVGAWLAPSAMRLAIFGSSDAADILLPWRGRKRVTPEKPHPFTLGRTVGLPPRTGGCMILLDNGSTAFRYRRWCVLDERMIPLSDGTRHIEKGIFSPALVHGAGGKEAVKGWLRSLVGKEVQVHP